MNGNRHNYGYWAGLSGDNSNGMFDSYIYHDGDIITWPGGNTGYYHTMPTISPYQGGTSGNPIGVHNDGFIDYVNKPSFVNTVFDSFGKSLVKNSGNSTYGFGKFYWHTEEERGFYGNQYGKTVRLSAIGKKITNITKKVGIVFAVGNVLYGAYMDYKKNEPHGYNTIHALGGIAGSYAGTEAGVLLGGKIGGSIGSLFCGIGVVPGAIIGGTIFGVLGTVYGEQFGDYVIDVLYEKKIAL